MYIDPARVHAELSRRRHDRGLMAAVLEFVGSSLPPNWPEDRPIATLDRYLATARFEDVMFSHAAHSLALRPYWPTYHGEKYITRNPEKVSCLRPRVQTSKLQTDNRWLVKNHERFVGTALGEIRVNGSSLQAIHDAARRVVLSQEVVDNVFDISDWLREQAYRFGAVDGAPLAPFYYNATMALNICYGVLFEDFDAGPNEGSGLALFVRRAVRPAIARVEAEFGLSPLIVRLPYIPGFLEFPAATAAVFDRHRE